MLQTRGRQQWAKLAAGSKNPAELKEAARQLADAGKLKAIRGRDSGTLYIVATEALEGEKRAETRACPAPPHGHGPGNRSERNPARPPRRRPQRRYHPRDERRG